MRITPLQKLIAIVFALGFGYLVGDYYHLFAGEPMYAIQGRIRLEGKPLNQGMIQFFPIESDHNKSAGGIIRNGEYAVPQQFGLPPGRYQVHVTSLLPEEIIGNAVALTEGKEDLVVEERVPERFNIHSEIYIDLTKGEVLELDLDLK